MCVVDEHRERLALVKALEPTGDPFDGLDPLPDRGFCNTERTCGGRSRERVLAVEATLQLELQA